MAQEHPHRREAGHRLAIVSSAGEEEDSASDDEAPPFKFGDPSSLATIQTDDLYGANLDDEDEAWVYKNLRSGVEETVTIKKISNNNNEQLEQAKLLKPRSSDAVLSCPCCLSIVCMDCQRHERFENQYRAMFVMNIGVKWNTQLVYDDKTKTLVEKGGGGSSSSVSTNNGTATLHHRVPVETGLTATSDDVAEEVYYPVFCLNCQTQVAALDMRDEVYHFFGCCASA